jgi:hypothetical protein
MGSRIYPTLRCSECGEESRLIAICEKPGEGTETRFYECSNPLCRDSFEPAFRHCGNKAGSVCAKMSKSSGPAFTERRSGPSDLTPALRGRGILLGR